MIFDFHWPHSATAVHRDFVSRALPVLHTVDGILAVAAAGSWADDAMDEFSDLDLVVGVQPSAFERVMSDREAIASRLGDLLAAFPGDHVGEPRVLICLYGSPLVHVDLKFVRVDDIGATVDHPAVLWERDVEFSKQLQDRFVGYAAPDADWIEARFWTWIHYGASKVLRGELYEALDLIGFLRGRVLGPLILERAGARPMGVRRLELAAPEWSDRLRRTVAAYDARSCLDALQRCAEIYRDARPARKEASAVELAAIRYLHAAIDRATTLV